MIVIDQPTRARLIAGPTAQIDLRAWLQYDPADPYAVLLAMLQPDHSGTITWRIDRDSLAAYTTGRPVDPDTPTSDDSDYHLYRWPRPTGDVIAILWADPTRPGKVCHVEILASAVRRYLRRTWTIVPAGRESEILADQVDTGLAALMDGRR